VGFRGVNALGRGSIHGLACAPSFRARFAPLAMTVLIAGFVASIGVKALGRGPTHGSLGGEGAPGISLVKDEPAELAALRAVLDKRNPWSKSPPCDQWVSLRPRGVWVGCVCGG